MEMISIQYICKCINKVFDIKVTEKDAPSVVGHLELQCCTTISEDTKAQLIDKPNVNCEEGFTVCMLSQGMQGDSYVADMCQRCKYVKFANLTVRDACCCAITCICE